MTNQELCTQYELIVAMLKSGNTEEVVKILDDAIKRIKRLMMIKTINNSDFQRR